MYCFRSGTVKFLPRSLITECNLLIIAQKQETLEIMLILISLLVL